MCYTIGAFSADYLINKAIAARKTPADIIGEMVKVVYWFSSFSASAISMFLPLALLFLIKSSFEMTKILVSPSRIVVFLE